MKVTTVTTVQFEPKDFEMLKKEFPENPCQACTPAERAVCCGCMKEKLYRDEMQSYKDANLTEYVGAIASLRDMRDSVNEFYVNMKANIKRLPVELQDLILEDSAVFRDNTESDRMLQAMLHNSFSLERTVKGNKLMQAAQQL